jgi:hypothetical protein
MYKQLGMLVLILSMCLVGIGNVSADNGIGQGPSFSSDHAQGTTTDVYTGHHPFLPHKIRPTHHGHEHGF